jgi:translation initiation factor 2 gamma subunit (eIF-2gamma)
VLPISAKDGTNLEVLVESLKEIVDKSRDEASKA